MILLNRQGLFGTSINKEEHLHVTAASVVRQTYVNSDAKGTLMPHIYSLEKTGIVSNKKEDYSFQPCRSSERDWQ